MSDEQALRDAAETETPAEAQSAPPEAGAQVAADPVATLKAELAEAQAKAASNWDSYLRLAAEMENLRKRMQRDLENAHKFGLERFLAELLPVKDSLELGIAAAGEAANADGHREGMDMTLKLLSTVLERAGVTELAPAKGESFDPEQHEAMAMQEDAETEPGTVLATVQKGYALNGRLLRPARVLVAKAPAPAA